MKHFISIKYNNVQDISSDCGCYILLLNAPFTEDPHVLLKVLSKYCTWICRLYHFATV